MDSKIEEFKKYTNNYINISNMCILKVNHTMRVMNLCEKIAESLELSKEDIELAQTCGLVHDIARFEQWKNFKTFLDSKSIDHGDYGVKILRENNFIRKFNKDEKLDDLILKTVKYHNKLEIEKSLSKREKLFCNIVRDADKLDILYLYITQETVLNTQDEDFSDEVYESLMKQKTISKNIKKTKADNLAISLGFAFDFNFNISYKIIKEKNYYNQEIDFYKNKSNNENFKKKLENIRNVINKYIDGRCNNVR